MTEHDPSRSRLSIADQPRFDCRDAYVETLAELAARGPPHRRRRQRLGRLQQARRVQEGVPRPADQRRHRRAGHGRRRRRTGQRRPDPVRLGGVLLPDRARAGADQGRRRLLQPQREAVRHEPRHGVRRTRPDPPLDRGHRLAARHRQHDDRRAGRPDRDRRGACAGPPRSRARCSSGSAG